MGTRNRYSFLTETIRHLVFDHLGEYAVQKGINLKEVNGYSDHVHCLISLNSDQNIATVVNMLKGESSFWINRQKLTKARFGWADEYFAASVSHSALNAVSTTFRIRKPIIRRKASGRSMSFLWRGMGLKRTKALSRPLAGGADTPP